jgi:hypothetical protein
VTVVGAGVAGLTAAHALAERGFTVFVVESASGDGTDVETRDVRVGGVASSHASQLTPRFAFDSRRLGRQPRTGAPRLGFRQIPRHFRHVRDVLRAIPIHGKESALTLADTLTRVRVRTLGDPLFPFLLPEGAYAGVGDSSSSGMAGATPSRKDLLVYSCRLLRYMSTSSERRRAECEDISFAEYVRGHNSRESRVPLVYEARFLKALDRMPRGLAVLDPAHIDARTGLNLVEQLVFGLLDAPPGVDVLPGPTGESWFLPWQQHLMRLGVTFHHAMLDRLSLEDGHLRAHFTKGGRRPWRGSVARMVSDADYLVLAVDAVSAERLVRDLPDIGVPAGLRGYTTMAPPNPSDRKGTDRPRDPVRHSPLDPADRLQGGIGLQFYFQRDIEQLHGLTYISGSPWSLVTFMDPRAPERRGPSRRDDLSFVLRVEICAWNTPGLAGHAPASRSARPEIAVEAWRQIKQAACAAGVEVNVPDPLSYNIDRIVRFADARQGSDPDGKWVDGDGIPVANHAPYLMPVASDWDARPGADPWDPTGIGAARPFGSNLVGIWQADHGGYLVHWNRLVFAGAYTRTFTRLTTMESACESARHAVNAILDHRWWIRVARRRTRDNVRVGRSAEAAAPEYCLVWDPERFALHERPAKMAQDLERMLSLAKRVDRQAFGLGRRHCWETLFFDRYLEMLAKGSGTDPTEAFGDFVKSYYSKLQGLAGSAADSRPDWATMMSDTLKALTDLRGILTVLDSLVRPPQGQGR